MPNRKCNVDLARFICSLFIMINHIGIVLLYKPFNDFWLYVEFFLIITGYYTTKHFDNKNYSNPVKEGVAYSLKKFIPFLPYTVITTVLLYLLNIVSSIILGGMDLQALRLVVNWGSISNVIFDMFLITSSIPNTFTLVGSLWFLSAMFIVFPLFSMIVQLRNRYNIIIVTALYALFYYGIQGVADNRAYPNDFLRVMAGMCLGAFIYEITYVFGKYIYKINKKILTVVEVVTFLLPIIIIFKNYNANRLNLFCFTICLFIMLSNLSYTSNIKGSICVYLGRLSLPIFVIHWFIAEVLSFLENYYIWSDIQKIVLYYGLTIIVSMIAMYLVDHWKWFQETIKKPIILKD